jgi:hypothetical protein
MQSLLQRTKLNDFKAVTASFTVIEMIPSDGSRLP